MARLYILSVVAKAVNDQHDVEYKYVQGAGGSFTFRTPSAGDWDMRLHDEDNQGLHTGLLCLMCFGLDRSGMFHLGLDVCDTHTFVCWYTGREVASLSFKVENAAQTKVKKWPVLSLQSQKRFIFYHMINIMFYHI
jgi:hypothetical protein